MADERPIHQPPDEQLTQELTIDYMAMPWSGAFQHYANRPWFTLMMMQTMLLDQQVWFGLQLRNAPLIQAEVKVKSPSTVVAAFVQAQWDRFWKLCASKVLATKYYGYAGLEMRYIEKHGLLEFESAKDFAPYDIRPLRQATGCDKGRIAGLGVHGHRNSLTGDPAKSPTRLFGMKGLWLSYQSKAGSPFGEAATHKAYAAWWDKAMPGGAYDMRRLRAVKDAWIGDVIWYPTNKKMTRPDGTEISAKDMAREFVEIRQSGGVGTLPSDCDSQGNPLFRYERPTDVADTGTIRSWLEDVDWDIFDGLLVPKEVVEAASSGSGFSGRSIPFVMFLAMCDIELMDYVQAWKKQAGEPLVVRNFGEAANDFEMEPVPLLDTMAEKMGGQSMGGPVGGSSGGQSGGYHQGPPDGRPMPQNSQAPNPRQAVQFAIADEPEASRRRRTVKGIESRGGEIARRLERLLKKN